MHKVSNFKLAARQFVTSNYYKLLIYLVLQSDEKIWKLLKDCINIYFINIYRNLNIFTTLFTTTKKKVSLSTFTSVYS